MTTRADVDAVADLDALGIRERHVRTQSDVAAEANFSLRLNVRIVVVVHDLYEMEIGARIERRPDDPGQTLRTGQIWFTREGPVHDLGCSSFRQPRIIQIVCQRGIAGQPAIAPLPKRPPMLRSRPETRRGK